MAIESREPSRTERVAHGLRNIFKSARDRARDQGIVEGSTMFFKNLAESVAFSHRNLRIGLAFVTAALVVVSASMGVLVARAFTSQQRTRETLERQMKGTGEDLARQLAALQTTLNAIDARQRRLEEALAKTEAAQKEAAEAGRKDLADVRAGSQKELAELKKTNEELRLWVQSFNRTYLIDRQVLVQRIDALSAPKK